ncbi:hypothetical protein ACFL6L_00445 [candidate division KSB1 bacterium]
MRLTAVIILLSGLFAISAISSAQEHEPDIVWKTLGTDHFLIHFPQEHETLAKTIAGICEEVYEPVSASLNYHPGVTHVVIHTRTDRTNGFLAPLPYRMELFVTDSQDDHSGSRDTWLRTLITHEFTHNVHFRKHKGLSSITRPFFGDLNGFWHYYATPPWFIEGIATVNETRFTNGGRGRNPYHWMQMTAPAASGSFRDLDNTNYNSRKRLPYGMSYVSGYFLTDHIAAAYGERVWADILDRYTSNPLPGFNNAVKKVTGASDAESYNALLDKIRDSREYKTDNVSPASVPYRNTIPASDHSPRWVDNNSLIAYHTGYDDLPGLIQIEKNGTREKLIDRVLTNTVNGFSVNNDIIVWSELRRHIRFSATDYSDLMVYDRATGASRRLTQNERLFSPDISPDGSKIAAALNKTGSVSLVTVNVRSGEIRELLSLPRSMFLNPRWSPDGGRIAFALKNEYGRQDIAVYEMNTGEFTCIAGEDDFHDNEPCWTPDGRYILYTSDRSGRFNIWAIETDTGQKYQVTDIQLGAFTPDVSPDGSILAFSGYTEYGFAVYTKPLDRNSWKPLDSVVIEQHPLLFNREAAPLPFESPLLSTASVQAGGYSAWRQIIKPFGRIPVVMEDENGYAAGIYGLSADVLNRHAWEGLFLINPDGMRPYIDMTYSYKRWWPKFDINAYYLPEKVTYRGYTGWWRKQGVDLFASLPMMLESNVRTSYLVPSFGLRSQRYEHSTGVIYPGLNDYRGYYAGMYYYRASQTLRDVVPHSMVSASITADWSDKSFDSDFTAQKISGMGRTFIPTFIDHHQVELTAVFRERRGRFNFDHFNAQPVGYSETSLKYQVRLKTGYHFPISYIEYPLPVIPFYIDYLAGQVFYDWGTSWGNNSLSWDDRKVYSAGLQVTLANFAFHLVPVTAGLRMYYRSADQKWTLTPLLGFSIPR